MHQVTPNTPNSRPFDLTLGNFVCMYSGSPLAYIFRWDWTNCPRRPIPCEGQLPWSRKYCISFANRSSHEYLGLFTSHTNPIYFDRGGDRGREEMRSKW